jgi:hypothetical protein
MEKMISDLMERLHPPLSKPLSPGVAVKTERGYGTIVGEFRGNDHFYGRAEIHAPTSLIVQLDGSNDWFVTTAARLQVVEEPVQV